MTTLRRAARFAPLLALSLGLGVFPTLAGAQQRVDPEDAYRQLRGNTVYIQPGLSVKLDTGRMENLAKQLKPRELRVMVIKQIGGKWLRNGQERRGAFAQYVNDDKLNLGAKGVTIVVTQRGAIGYAQGVPQAKLSQLGEQAMGQIRNQHELTAPIETLAKGVVAAAPQVDARGEVPGFTTGREPTNFSGLLCGGLCIGVPIAGGIAWILAAKKAKAKKLAAAREAAQKGKDAATDALSYIDSYDGLLPAGDAAEAVRQYRQRMGDSYEQGLAQMNAATNEIAFGNATRAFSQSLQDFELAKQQIQLATGGTGVGFRIPPVLDTSNAPLLDPVPGVSFFSSQPSDQLVPVEVSINGQRRTVMVTPEERDQFQRGQVPQMLGTQQNGGFQPWYDNSGYDPRRDWSPMGYGGMGYGSPWSYGYGGWGGGWGWGHSPLDGLLLGYGLGSIFGGGGGWGGGYHHHYGGDYVGSGDHGWGNGNVNDSSNDFGGSTDSSVFGGSDFGGGGSDWGGSSDSGGGFDFGGGGSDFGGGDSGGGGGDW